jgi:hypothetical protein
MSQQTATQRRTERYMRRSESAPFDAAGGFVPPVARNLEPPYVLANRKIIRTIIHENVGQSQPLEGQAADALKRLKIDNPAKYDGKDNADHFDSWILNLVRWMRMQNLVGPARDYTRILVLGFYLEGDAHTWYDDVIAAPDRIVRDWTFEEAILQLHKRFISGVAAIRASEKFFKCTYHASDGVAGLYNRLNRCARRMVQHPGDYAIRQQFLKALPDEIRAPLINFRSITAEGVTLTHLRNHAMQVEENNRIATQLGMGPVVLAHPRREKTQDNAQGSGKYDSREERRQRRRERRESRDRKSKRPVVEAPRGEPRVNEQRRDFGNFRARNPAFRPARPPRDKPDVDLSTIKCYACGKFGHYASDPKCEKYGDRADRPRVTAMAIEEEADNRHGNTKSSVRSHTRSVRTRSSGSSGSSSSSTDSTSDSDRSYDSVHDLDRYERESPTLSFYSNASSASSSSLTSSNDDSSDDSVNTVRLAGMSAMQPYLAPMTIDLTAQKVKVLYKGEGKDPNVYDSNIRRKGSSAQPERTPETQRVMTALVVINGALAWTMFDTGSTADCVAPEFARVNKLKTFDLEAPVPLQLGTKGSKSTITYGTNVEIKPSETLHTVEYMDIINIDRYDAILGTPYMSKHGVVLNLRDRTISFGEGSKIRALSSEEEAKYRGISAHLPTPLPKGNPLPKPAVATKKLAERRASENTNVATNGGSSKPSKSRKAPDKSREN